MDIIKRGRLGASDDATRRFLSIFDEWVFPANLAVDRAHVVMLAERGIVDGDDAAAVLDALAEIEAAGFGALPERGDVHVAIEEALIDRLGEAVGGVLHTARSRNDKGATYVRLALRGELLALVEAVLDLRATLTDRAGETADWLVAGYTHLQRAQPTTFGHHLLAHEAALGRDVERLIDAYGRVNRNPLGSCAMAGTGFDIDRERTTELLGFDRPTPNSMDGVAGWDFAVEAVAAAAAAMNSLSRLCADLFVWSSREFGFVELDDRHAGSSSIMPQKKNPNTATAARAKAGTVLGSATALASITRGLPMSLSYDVWEANRHLRESFRTARESVRIIEDTVRRAAFDREAMEESVDGGFATATELADTIVRGTDLPFRTAHHVVARIARESGGEGVDAAAVDRAAREVTGEGLDLDPEAVERALDPRANVEVRDSLGGPGDLPRAIASARERRTSHADWLAARDDELDAAEEELSAAADAVGSG